MLSLRVDTLVCLTGVLLLLNFLLLVVDDFLLALSKCVTDEEFKEIREDDEQSLLLTRTRLVSKLLPIPKRHGDYSRAFAQDRAFYYFHYY